MKGLKKSELLEKYPVLGSSKNPEKVKLRITAVLVGLIPIAIFVLRYFGLENIQETDLIKLIDMLSNAGMYITALVATAMEIWGWIRKFRK